MTQMMPLAESQPPGTLDVIWASQLFFPRVSPAQVPSPTHPITKLVTRGPAEGSGDVGTFLLDGDAAVGFVPQGSEVESIGADTASDLGSFRLRADGLDALQRVYLAAPVQGHRDLDPHLTAPLLSGAGDTADEAAMVRELLGGQPVIGVTDLGVQIPWWRLRRPHELRDCALDVRPSADQPALRHLLGIDHPITQSWLGETWVEGPEYSWQDVLEGVEIAGIRIADSTVQHSALQGWTTGGRSPVPHPVIEGCVLTHATGGVALEACWVTLCGTPGLRGGGGLAWRVSGPIPHDAGPAPTATGLCEVRRPRLMDGRAVFFGFMDEDAKETEHEIRGHTGVSWAKLVRLPPHHGPNPTDAAALDAATPYRVDPVPPEVLALIRSRLPPGSALTHLADLAEANAFSIATHQGCRPLVDVEGALVPGRTFHTDNGGYRLHLDTETQERWRWSTAKMAEALVRCWGTYFLPCVHGDRRQFAEHRVGQWRRDLYGADQEFSANLADALQRGAGAAVLGQLAHWRSAADPDRVQLSALFLALDTLDVQVSDLETPELVLAWSRWRLEHRQDTAPELTARLAEVPRELLDRAGFWWSHRWVDGGRPRWIPRKDLRPSRPSSGNADPAALAASIGARAQSLLKTGRPAVIGVCGPAAAGKSSLAEKIAEHLDHSGMRVGYVEADAATWQGHGFRYIQGESTRQTTLFGPGIVDEVHLARQVRHQRGQCDAVIVEGCFVGLDPQVRELLDLHVGVILDDPARLGAKYARDALGGRRRIDVVTDFAAKTHHETIDGIAPILAHAEVIWDRGTGEVWRR